MGWYYVSLYLYTCNLIRMNKYELNKITMNWIDWYDNGEWIRWVWWLMNYNYLYINKINLLYIFYIRFLIICL
jgi:hypothetical protein